MYRIFDGLAVNCLSSHSKKKSFIWDVTICRWKAAKFLVLCSTFMAFKQGGIFIVPYLLRHGPFLCYPSKVSIAFYDKQRVPRTQSTLDSYGHTVGEFEKGTNAVHYHYIYVMSLCWRYHSQTLLQDPIDDFQWMITTIGTTPKVWMMHVLEIFAYLRRMGQSLLEFPHAIQCFSPRHEICMIFRDFIIKFIH